MQRQPIISTGCNFRILAHLVLDVHLATLFVLLLSREGVVKTELQSMIRHSVGMWKSFAYWAAASTRPTYFSSYGSLPVLRLADMHSRPQAKPTWPTSGHPVCVRHKRHHDWAGQAGVGSY